MTNAVRSHVKAAFPKKTGQELYAEYMYFTRGLVKYLYEAMRRENLLAEELEVQADRFKVILPGGILPGSDEGKFFILFSLFFSIVQSTNICLADFSWENADWGPPFPFPGLPGVLDDERTAGPSSSK